MWTRSGTHVFLLGLLAAAALLKVATALEATITVVVPNGTALELPVRLPLPPAGGCDNCTNLMSNGRPESLPLRTYSPGQTGANVPTPVILTVGGAPNDTVVAFIAFATPNCTGTNYTSYFTDFKEASVGVDKGSKFPTELQSFGLCVGSTSGSK
ncbi:hypothetical protein N2152v2_005450 [Parachlorella kessleri]